MGRPVLVPAWLRDVLMKAVSSAQMSLFDEQAHPRKAKGPGGGQFAPKGQGKAGGGKPATAKPAEGGGERAEVIPEEKVRAVARNYFDGNEKFARFAIQVGDAAAWDWLRYTASEGLPPEEQLALMRRTTSDDWDKWLMDRFDISMDKAHDLANMARSWGATARNWRSRDQKLQWMNEPTWEDYPELREDWLGEGEGGEGKPAEGGRVRKSLHVLHLRKGAFANPFVTQLPGRSLAPEEVARALRLALCAEEEAISIYEAIAEASDDPTAAGVLRKIADEERVHVGELQEVIERLNPQDVQLLESGRQEARDVADAVRTRTVAVFRGGGAGV